MGAERDSVFADFAQVVQAEHLKAAGVGEDGSRPRHEAVQAAQAPDSFDAGAQVKVIRVAQKNLNAEFFEKMLRHALDRSQRPDGHKHGSLDFAMRRKQASGAGATASGLDVELKGHWVGL